MPTGRLLQKRVKPPRPLLLTKPLSEEDTAALPFQACSAWDSGRE